MKSMTLLFVAVLVSMITLKTFAQDYEWAKGIGGVSDDSNKDMALDSQGNVYIIGTFQGTNIDFDPGLGTAYLSSAGGLDFFIAKYDSYGNYLWAKSIGGSGNDYGVRIVVDGVGNAYVAGWFESTDADFDPGPGTVILSTAGYADIFFAKYDPNGNYLWAHRFGGTYYDGCHDIVRDSMNNVYVTGYFYGANIDFDPGPGTAYLSSVANSGDIFFAKYDSAGNYLWAKGTGGSNYEVGNGIALDDSGNVYLTGPFMGTNVDFDPGFGTAYLSSAGGYDVFLAKFDPSGGYVWARRIGGTGDDIGGDLVVGRSGNFYVTGCFHGTNIDFDPDSGTAFLNSAGAYDIFFARYDASANYIWAERIGGASDDYGGKIILDGSGDMYLSGSFQGTSIDFDPGPGIALLNSAGVSDVFFARYDSLSGYVWAQRLGGGFDDYDGGIAVDGFSHIYVAGSFVGINVDFDPGPGTAYLSSMGGTDIFLSKYSQTSTGVRGDAESEVPNEFRLDQNYPNPFNPNTTIGYQLSTQSYVTLKVFDMLGCEVAALMDGVEAPGSKSVRWDAGHVASGIYFCRLSVVPLAQRGIVLTGGQNGQARGFTQTKKLILMK